MPVVKSTVMSGLIFAADGLRNSCRQKGKSLWPVRAISVKISACLGSIWLPTVAYA